MTFRRLLIYCGMLAELKPRRREVLGCYKNNGCVQHALQTASRVSSSDMRIFATVFVILVSTFIVNASILDPVIENVVHLQASKPPGDVPGIWKKKTIWKPRWVKEWKSAKVMKPVWRKVWSPVQIREWVPIPKPPPGWSAAASTPLAPIKTTPKENLVPLWDPVPYPESQQPPPPSPQHHHHHQSDVNCGPGGCDSHTSQTFNHHQITEIIGSERYKKGLDHHESGEYSESVAHLTGLPSSWEQPEQHSFDVQFADGFADYSELSPFLVPPRFQNTLNYNQKESEFHHHHHHHDHHHHEPTGNVQITHSPGFEVNHIVPHRWTPLQAIDNKDEKRFVAVKTPDQPYKFQVPENYVRNVTTTTSHKHLPATKSPASGPDGDLSAKPNFQTHKINKLQAERKPDLIQSSQLVGEYHYSESSLTGNVKPETGKLQFRPEIKEQTRTRPKQVEQSRIKPHIDSKPDFRPPLIETKPRPTKKENKKPQQRPPPLQNGPPNHQNHHSTPSKHDFEQTKADIQEIAPNFVVATPPVPPNHKPSPNTTIPPPRAPVTSAPDTNSLVPALETHSEKNFIVQVVYPTPQHHQKIPPFRSLPELVPSETLNKINPNLTRSREDVLTLDTATLRSAILTSSSTTTSKPDTSTTKSSVFIVTPIYPERS